MTDKVRAALILGAALIIAAMLVGGIYQITATGPDLSRIYRLNRFTGSMTLTFMNKEIPVSAVSSLPTATATPQ